MALLTAAAFLFVFVQPRDSTPSTSDNTASQLDSTNSDESAGSSTQQRDGTETHPTDTSRPGSPNSTSTSDSDQEAFPDGVHSVKWGDAPANYTAGQTGARLLLSVRFDNSGTPADYDVVVTLPEGVTLVRASAGCTANGSEVRCDPPDNLRPTDLFSLQFYVDLDSSFSGGLPTADLVNSGS
ncbi:hypothetical protein G7066_11605 [Leucobacter coleopterorum]|uniref:Uncharacterized protein n=1 Tax=Leucobacter coleopterorum TaxID=2714933 RepID=A0ABX6JXV2_9MICO|nr:hypothetical protein [Leucobacter coleopterorum]QIM19053.1 hypothetical protein G7066_11605 [Leucobacter coleopterorum]